MNANRLRRNKPKRKRSEIRVKKIKVRVCKFEFNGWDLVPKYEMCIRKGTEGFIKYRNNEEGD